MEELNHFNKGLFALWKTRNTNDKWMGKNMKIGFTCGSFDLIHPGYMSLFMEAKKACDYLIVGLQVDPSQDRPHKNKPIQSLTERMVVLGGIKHIDQIVVYHNEEELYKLMQLLPIDVYILGSDWEGKEFTGHDLGFEIHFNKRIHSLSATGIRKRILEQETQK